METANKLAGEQPVVVIGGASESRPRRRPYDLRTFIEFVAGPMPSAPGDIARYRLRTQGMYNNYAMKQRAVITGADGAPVVRFLDRPINRRWWIRKAASGLTAVEADQLACAAGVHPSMIWSSWFDDANEELGAMTEGDWRRIDVNDARRDRQRFHAWRQTAA
jgi:hypothetical protein